MWMFVYCYFGTHITMALNDIGIAVHESNWYNYPIQVQQALGLTIARARIPFIFKGLKMFNCNLETFLKVKEKIIVRNLIWMISNKVLL